MERAEPLRILVTGANGFIGRRLCSELVRQGHTLRVALRDSSRASGLAGEIIPVGTLNPRTDWTKAVIGIDAVVHLAGRVHVVNETAIEPLQAFRAVNLGATEALAQAAARAGVRRYVYVSSIKVNGEATAGQPFSANDPPHPRDPYGVSKWDAEQALRRIEKETDLEVAVVRPPLVYGPGVRGNFLRLMKLVRSGIPLPFGAVANQRSMIYNGNLAHALIACTVKREAAGNTYLVSDGDDLSTADLVRLLAKSMGKTARLLPVPVGILRFLGASTGKAEDIDRLVSSLRVDSSRLRADLGWRPPFSVEEGIAETARWFAASRP
jgi:nucleoside-diphosphate-sugar epimerase